MAESIVRISGVNTRKCMKCGKCSGTCPAFHEMDIHPHQFISMVEKGKITALIESKSLWKCLSCFACVERCPRNVEPVKLIEAARLSVIRKQGENRLKAD
ncbi:MAG: 4Fe-4S dicluster domain-containing protein, partial [Clostridiales bacterium]|nr:4Fe-4S dicluster domain-containing protein [Clostridiales bacterium]